MSEGDCSRPPQLFGTAAVASAHRHQIASETEACFLATNFLMALPFNQENMALGWTLNNRLRFQLVSSIVPGSTGRDVSQTLSSTMARSAVCRYDQSIQFVQFARGFRTTA